jgi:hypothetical protein
MVGFNFLLMSLVFTTVCDDAPPFGDLLLFNIFSQFIIYAYRVN